jgi:hypothetical protein
MLSERIIGAHQFCLDSSIFRQTRLMIMKNKTLLIPMDFVLLALVAREETVGVEPVVQTAVPNKL